MDVQASTPHEHWHSAGPHAVVIGGSAGSIDVIRRLLRCLPATLDLPVVVVLHQSARPPDGLPELLGRDCALPVKQAEDKEPLMPGSVYLAPPGYHLLIESHRAFALSIDPPVHFSRPSIDVLFESARDAYGSHLLGILLSGASNDGANAMQEIHLAGGMTIVQSPDSAEAPTMPLSALALFQPAFVCSPQEMATRLPSLLSPATQQPGVRSLQ